MMNSVVPIGLHLGSFFDAFSMAFSKAFFQLILDGILMISSLVDLAFSLLFTMKTAFSKYSGKRKEQLEMESKKHEKVIILSVKMEMKKASKNESFWESPRPPANEMVTVKITRMGGVGEGTRIGETIHQLAD